MDRFLIIVFGLFPGWGWALLIGVAWAILVYLALGRLKLRGGRTLGLLAAITLRAAAAASIAIITSLDVLNDFACLTGIFGIPLTPLFLAVEAGLLYALSKQWPRTSAGRKDRFALWILIWLAFDAIALIAHFRSALMCTV
ncbi:MAG: hypothetical protein IT473_11215 [Lysobacter sp.]|nr:hypothetical protein [Lysobacter sp.]